MLVEQKEDIGSGELEINEGVFRNKTVKYSIRNEGKYIWSGAFFCVFCGFFSPHFTKRNPLTVSSVPVIWVFRNIYLM